MCTIEANTDAEDAKVRTQNRLPAHCPIHLFVLRCASTELSSLFLRLRGREFATSNDFTPFNPGWHLNASLSSNIENRNSRGGPKGSPKVQRCRRQLLRDGAILFATMRNPISRIVSEFYFSGPGSGNSRSPSVGLNESAWMNWIRKGDECSLKSSLPHSDADCRRTFFVDNYFIRKLGVASCPASCLFCEPGCGSGCASSIDPWGRSTVLSDHHLERAKETLSHFVVAILGTMNERDPALWLCSALGLRDEAVGGKHRCPLSGSFHANHFHASESRAVPQAVRAELERRNALDLELYQWVVRNECNGTSREGRSVCRPWSIPA